MLPSRQAAATDTEQAVLKKGPPPSSREHPPRSWHHRRLAVGPWGGHSTSRTFSRPSSAGPGKPLGAELAAAPSLRLSLLLSLWLPSPWLKVAPKASSQNAKAPPRTPPPPASEAFIQSCSRISQPLSGAGGRLRPRVPSMPLSREAPRRPGWRLGTMASQWQEAWQPGRWARQRGSATSGKSHALSGPQLPHL